LAKIGIALGRVAAKLSPKLVDLMAKVFHLGARLACIFQLLDPIELRDDVPRLDSGTIGNQPEIDPVIDAAHRLRLDPRFQFVIAGEGSRLEHYRMAARGLSNTALPGWLNRAEIRVLLDHATAGLVPYPHRGDWLTALPNKFAEYLSASVPLLVSLTTGKMLEFAEANGCGLGYGHSGERLANRLVELAESPERLRSLRHAAKRAFETHFKADVVYGGMVDYLERLVASRATVQRRTS